MNKFRHLIGITFVLLLVLSVSCNSEPPKKCDGSFEVSPTKDTVNRIDCDGKQGIWVPRPSNKLTDTLYYKNDILVTE
ncbi:MAG: hypothetical protein Q7W45_13725 [Bacteroidota bacterium]|nr:hypothetical protein [Bacteroidota bacterium]MDP3144419.1 hypothetical protein [Bacteroidota bacterium]MDP3555903.1 hypothetical protein [Bacteroidota bacterium]